MADEAIFTTWTHYFVKSQSKLESLTSLSKKKHIPHNSENYKSLTWIYQLFLTVHKPKEKDFKTVTLQVLNSGRIHVEIKNKSKHLRILSHIIIWHSDQHYVKIIIIVVYTNLTFEHNLAINTLPLTLCSIEKNEIWN